MLNSQNPLVDHVAEVLGFRHARRLELLLTEQDRGGNTKGIGPKTAGAIIECYKKYLRKGLSDLEAYAKGQPLPEDISAFTLFIKFGYRAERFIELEWQYEQFTGTVEQLIGRHRACQIFYEAIIESKIDTITLKSWRNRARLRNSNTRLF